MMMKNLRRSEVKYEPRLLIAAGAIAGAMLLIGVLGDSISDGARFAFDSTVLLWARGGAMHGSPIGPAWFKAAMIDITAVGGVTVLVLVVTLVSGFLVLKRRWFTLGLLLGGTVSGSLTVSLIKNLVGRPRPEITDHLVQVSSLSFPSGHAANSAIVYLTMAALIDQIVEGSGARLYVIGSAASLVILIGFSRVYLGVHWPSDVLAGWVFGTLWAIAWWEIGVRGHAKPAGAQ